MAEIGHGGKEIVERILEPSVAKAKIEGLPKIEIRSQIANEVIDIAYGFFCPLEGFMGKADVESVCKKMRLADGTVWSIPILFDLTEKEVADYGVKPGASVLLTFGGNPMAILDVEEVFEYDKKSMCADVYGTDEDKHPGCARTYEYKDKFVAGKVTLVNRPKINSPYDPYFIPPLEMRKRFKEKGWERTLFWPCLLPRSLLSGRKRQPTSFSAKKSRAPLIRMPSAAK